MLMLSTVLLLQETMFCLSLELLVLDHLVAKFGGCHVSVGEILREVAVSDGYLIIRQ